ncbi:nucleotide sugar dehydrogenase [Aerococcaceae bacterium INB8]|uniref:UDP-glucose 6-dehydrogenase n=1 Tax=Ruoffia halotolerans TaxID=2748684 RepID=A0A839A8P1_9LACT|nr:nucleotide sugar dehydrogenase [Ruoffia halotolerans]MBA5730174.1 nucleotide sugar dehydrogenase [Ruoffia halotolerans]
MNITVVGLGYVGLSNAVLLAQHNNVRALEIVQAKVDLINQGKSPIKDHEIEEFLANGKLQLEATVDKDYAYGHQPEFVVIAAPTDYDDENDQFNTEALESALEDALSYAPEATIIIKSTIPVGYTKQINEKYQTDRIVFSPEFLREGKALYDNLHPSRIIVGEVSERAQKFADLMVEGAADPSVDVLLMPSTEAEAVKLFSNTYLALRVSYFNELDTYAESKGLDTKSIIDGVSLDPRIGDYYNNPSFGYGGYCLPKDTKQMLANYRDVPNNLIRAIVESNATRKEFISSQILKRNPEVVGIHRLTMKTDSDNFRQAAIFDIMKKIRAEGVEVVIYEPTIKEEVFEGYNVVNDLDTFKSMTSGILANRISEDIRDVSHKVYTRDVYNNN